MLARNEMHESQMSQINLLVEVPEMVDAFKSCFRLPAQASAIREARAMCPCQGNTEISARINFNAVATGSPLKPGSRASMKRAFKLLQHFAKCTGRDKQITWQTLTQHREGGQDDAGWDLARSAAAAR